MASLLESRGKELLGLLRPTPAVFLHAPEQLGEILVAVPLRVLRVLLEPPDVLEAEMRHGDEVVVLVLGAALRRRCCRHRDLLVVSFPETFPSTVGQTP